MLWEFRQTQRHWKMHPLCMSVSVARISGQLHLVFIVITHNKMWLELKKKFSLILKQFSHHYLQQHYQQQSHTQTDITGSEMCWPIRLKDATMRPCMKTGLKLSYTNCNRFKAVLDVLVLLTYLFLGYYHCSKGLNGK